MRSKERIAAANHLCQIDDSGSPVNTLIRNYWFLAVSSGQ